MSSLGLTLVCFVQLTVEPQRYSINNEMKQTTIYICILEAGTGKCLKFFIDEISYS